MNIAEARQNLACKDNNIGHARAELSRATKTRNHIIIQMAIEAYNKAHDDYEVAYAQLAEANKLGV